MPEILTSTEFWKFSAPLFGAVIAWFLNEWRKRIADQYQHKEASYRELIRSLQGYYQGASNAEELRQEFVTQLAMAWLYVPDSVIRKGYAFLDTVRANSGSSPEQKELAFASLMLELRQDILSRKLVRKTELSSSDYRHVAVAKQ